MQACDNDNFLPITSLLKGGMLNVIEKVFSCDNDIRKFANHIKKMLAPGIPWSGKEGLIRNDHKKTIAFIHKPIIHICN